LWRGSKDSGESAQDTGLPDNLEYSDINEWLDPEIHEQEQINASINPAARMAPFSRGLEAGELDNMRKFRFLW
jgi:hypothetical protein